MYCTFCATFVQFFFAISHRGQRVVKYFGRQACEHLELREHYVQHLCKIFAILHHCHCIVVKYFGGQACRHLEIYRLGKRGIARKPFSEVDLIWTQAG